MATTASGIYYPPLTNAPNVPSDMQSLANSIEGTTVPRFASAAARTAAMPSPVDGQLSFRTDLKRHERYWAATGAWSQFLEPQIQMHRYGSVQSIATGAIASVTWDGQDFNPANFSQSSSGVTMDAAGYIEVYASAEFAANATGRRFLTVLKNGAEVTGLARHTVPVNSATSVNATGMLAPGIGISVAVGDVITLGVFQDSGGSLNLSANATMRIRWAA